MMVEETLIFDPGCGCQEREGVANGKGGNLAEQTSCRKSTKSDHLEQLPNADLIGLFYPILERSWQLRIHFLMLWVTK
eukprot:4023176-Ditylum_brightwellii.AAC.1